MSCRVVDCDVRRRDRATRWTLEVERDGVLITICADVVADAVRWLQGVARDDEIDAEVEEVVVDYIERLLTAYRAMRRLDSIKGLGR